VVPVDRPGSIPFIRKPTGEEETDERAHADADGKGLVRIFTDGVVHGLRAVGGISADISRDLLGVCQCSMETLAGGRNFFPGHVGGGVQQRACVFGQCAHVTGGGWVRLIHMNIDLCS